MRREISTIDRQFLQAAYNGDFDGAVAALDTGADVNAVDPATGLTGLHIAVGTNNLPLARHLTEKRGAVFGPDKFGRWPTLVAAECRVDDDLSDYIVEREALFMSGKEGLAPPRI